MVEQNERQLSEILKAASDPTRRAILTLLAQEGPTRVTDLAEHYAMSLNSVSKHIKVLERAGLVTRRTLGRTHLIEANMAPTRAIDRWFSQLRSIWDMRLEKLETLMTKEPEMTDLNLNVSRIFNAAPNVLFDAWLNPEMLAKFMAPGPDMTVPHAANDPVEGGRFDIIMKSGDQELPHAGTYKEIDRHSRLVFTWESPMSVDDSTVTLTFTPVEGGTEVNLHHVKFQNEQMRDNHEGGWVAILAKLDAAVS